MKLNQKTVIGFEKDFNCPILEIFYTEKDNKWYVCFEEYYLIEGVEQDTHLEDILNAIKKYDNVEYITDEVYSDDDKENSYFEQVTFQWTE